MSDADKIHCPVCGKQATEQYAPFCSKRCADVDLNRWLSGVYVIHTEERPLDEEISVVDNEKN